MKRQLSAQVLVALLVGCCGISGSTRSQQVAATGSSARFTSAPTCVGGELTFTRNPIHVPSGGATVVKITPCNTASGDRMAAYIQRAGTCWAPTDSMAIGTNGDGGSDPSGGDFAIIAGATPCAGSYVEVTDLVTGAVGDATILVP